MASVTLAQLCLVDTQRERVFEYRISKIQRCGVERFLQGASHYSYLPLIFAL
jgi:hypothetical protein